MVRVLQSKCLVWGMVLGITAGLGCLDWLTGHRLSFFAFYFIPVGLAAWHLGLGSTVTVVIICTAVWFASDAAAGHIYDSHVLTVWNTLMRLSAFLIIGWSLNRMRRLLVSEQEASEALRRTMAEIKVLKGILPICAQCKKIRDEHGQWHLMERYISGHSGAEFTHGYCPDCARALLEEAGIARAERPSKQSPEKGPPRG